MIPEDISLTRSLYESAFPPDERRNFEDLLHIAQTRPAFHAEIFLQNTDLQGFIFYWKFADFIYVEHFALAEQFRGQGCGRKMMQDFCGKTPLPIVLEVEKPETETAIRRIRFYENLGFKTSEMPYVQPAYSPSQSPVPMLLIHRGDIGLEKCAETLMREVYFQN